MQPCTARCGSLIRGSVGLDRWMVFSIAKESCQATNQHDLPEPQPQPVRFCRSHKTKLPIRGCGLQTTLVFPDSDLSVPRMHSRNTQRFLCSELGGYFEYYHDYSNCSAAPDQSDFAGATKISFRSRAVDRRQPLLKRPLLVRLADPVICTVGCWPLVGFTRGTPCTRLVE